MTLKGENWFSPWETLLKEVSRTFYFSLKILPKEIRAPLGIAYLLARTADTIADTHYLPSQERRFWLNQYDQAVRDRNAGWGQQLVKALTEQQPRSGEGRLLQNIGPIIGLLQQLEREEQHQILAVLEQLIAGMVQDLVRFPGSTPHHLQALTSWEELEEYCYYAAGVVGPFWTRLMLRHGYRPSGSQEMMERWGEEFGKGLQLVNVLKDIAQDYQLGRCYLPAQELTRLGLAPRDLGRCEILPQLTPLLHTIMERALTYLASGERYLEHLPAKSWRMKLAVLWPLWIGYETLSLLRDDHALLDPQARHKISKQKLWFILVRSGYLVKLPKRLQAALSSMRGHHGRR